MLSFISKSACFLLLACVFLANASESDNAQQAYKIAIDKVVSARQQITIGQVMTFTETIKAKEAPNKTLSKSLYLDQAGNEVLMSQPDPQPQSESLNWRNNILLSPTAFPDKPQLLRETATTWVFKLPVKIGVDGAEGRIDNSKLTNNIHQALNAELTISRDNPRLLSQTIYATQPFKPESMVKVNVFQVRMEYQQAWPEGPWVTSSISRKLEGRYALFLSVDEFTHSNYSHFQLTDKKYADL